MPDARPFTRGPVGRRRGRDGTLGQRLRDPPERRGLRQHGRSRASGDDLLRAFFAEGVVDGRIKAEQGVDIETWINIYAADPDAPDGAALGETDQPRPGPEESADDGLADGVDEP